MRDLVIAIRMFKFDATHEVRLGEIRNVVVYRARAKIGDHGVIGDRAATQRGAIRSAIVSLLKNPDRLPEFAEKPIKRLPR